VKVTRSKTIPAGRDEIWDVISDPYHLPRWWPRVQRVEEVEGAGWTKVMISSRGRAVRADYTRVETDAPRRMLWRQEVDESPFERLLSEATIELELEDQDADATRVRLTADQTLRGKTRFGGMMVRRAAKRTLDDALDGLKRLWA
jgi:uncharacterized protein YndB with AHSA1/START domain